MSCSGCLEFGFVPFVMIVMLSPRSLMLLWQQGHPKQVEITLALAVHDYEGLSLGFTYTRFLLLLRALEVWILVTEMRKLGLLNFVSTRYFQIQNGLFHSIPLGILGCVCVSQAAGFGRCSSGRRSYADMVAS